MQHYDAALAAFRENLNQIDLTRDPVTYNLYAGLIALTSSLRSDMAELRGRLDQIEQDLRRPK